MEIQKTSRPPRHTTRHLAGPSISKTVRWTSSRTLDVRRTSPGIKEDFDIRPVRRNSGRILYVQNTRPGIKDSRLPKRTDRNQRVGLTSDEFRRRSRRKRIRKFNLRGRLPDSNGGFSTSDACRLQQRKILGLLNKSPGARGILDLRDI